tara:strand:- start:61 stop:207 length:147 start_codon:yes stop_codon:yes gene_type:complete
MTCNLLISGRKEYVNQDRQKVNKTFKESFNERKINKYEKLLLLAQSAH